MRGALRRSECSTWLPVPATAPVPPALTGGLTEVPGAIDLDPSGWTLLNDVDRDALCETNACLRTHEHSTVCATGRALAELIIARYRQGLSLQQVECALAEAGIAVNRTLLSAWGRQSAEALAPIAARIRAHGIATPFVTGANMSVTAKAGGRGRLWGYAAEGVSEDAPGVRMIWFRVTPDRFGAYAKRELAGYVGLLQVPPHSGYDDALASGTMTKVGCWRHVARQAREIAQGLNHPALTFLLAAVDALREIERGCITLSASERLAVRQRLSVPLLRTLSEQIDAVQSTVSPRSRLGALLSWMQSEWDSLTIFVHNGAVPLENGAIEQRLERLARRDPFIFARHARALAWASTIYTVLETCAANGVDERAYLTGLFSRLARATVDGAVDALMPWRFTS